MLRRLLLACLLFAAALALTSLSPAVGAVFALSVVVAPGVIALALNRMGDASPSEF